MPTVEVYCRHIFTLRCDNFVKEVNKVSQDNDVKLFCKYCGRLFHICELSSRGVCSECRYKRTAEAARRATIVRESRRKQKLDDLSIDE